MSKVVLVTGGTRGIGASIAKEFQAAGYQVAANYAGNDEAAEKFAQETGIKTYKWDVSDFDACREGVEKVREDFGSIDILVNNAGIKDDVMFHKMPLETWNKVLSVNLNSLYNMTSLVINEMRKANYGRIINLASVNALKGQLGQVNYSTTKAGVIGFSKALALENARKNITVNVIAPGYTDTDMVAEIDSEVLEGIKQQIPLGRLGKPEEIGKMALFLVSEGANYMTGATLNANGGQYFQ